MFERIIVSIVLALPFAVLGLSLLFLSPESVDKEILPILNYTVAIWLMGIIPIGLVLCALFKYKFDREKPGDSAIVFGTLGLGWLILVYYYFAKEIAFWVVVLQQRQKTK